MIATVGLLGILLGVAASVLLVTRAWSAARNGDASPKPIET